MVKVCLLDVETTHLDERLGEIIEIAAIIFNDETLEIIDSYETKIYPEHIETAHQKALAVNGYNAKEWDKKGTVYLEDMMKALSAGTRDCILMTFNIHFDMKHLDQATRTTGVELYFKRYPICLRAIAWHHMDHRNPFLTWSMKEVCERLGIPPEPVQHRAMNGVLAEFEIYKKLKSI